MSFEMNMLIMYYVQHVSTKIGEKNLQKWLKSTPQNTNQAPIT